MYLHYTEEERKGDFLLFLHGWGCDSSIFSKIIPLVHAHSIAVDLYGFGQSDAPPDSGYTVEQYADSVYQFVKSKGIDKLHIVAHSFGARIALILCAKYPEIVKSLIITGGAGLRRVSLKRTAKVCWHKLKKSLVKLHLLPKRCIEKRGSADYQNLQSVAMYNTFVKVIGQDLSAYAKQVSCPTLLVWGDIDKDTPMWIAKKLHKLMNNSSLVVIKGNHFAFLQNYVQFANIINAMIKE